MKPHRATGRPKGRPPKLPFDIEEQILRSLERRLDPETHLVRPDWKGMTREFNISRSTLSRIIAGLKRSGFLESISAPARPGSKLNYVFYRITSPSDAAKPPAGV